MPLPDLRSLVYSKQRAESEAAVPAAVADLESIFDRARWGVAVDIRQYRPQSYANLWDNELSSTIKHTLEDAGKTKDDYGAWLGEIQNVYIGIYWRDLFPTHGWNTGWRIAILAVPPVRAVALGIASYYQGTTNQRLLGQASNLLYDLGSKGLDAGSPLPGTKVGTTHWDGSALIPSPVTEVCGVDISPVAPEGLQLGDVRISTVKKNISSFIAIRSIVV